MTGNAGHRLPAAPRAPVRAVLGVAIACALLAGPAWADPAAPADAEFDSALLAGAGQSVDLSRFERGNVIMPGVYRLDLYLHGQWSGTHDVRFAAPSPDANAVACFTPELFDQLGLPRTKLDEAARARLEAAGGCVALSDLVPDATATYDQAELRLDVTVPQAWLGYRARGYVSPEQWDDGVTAALLNYNVSAYRTRSAGLQQTTGYAGLNAGFNLGAWRLRHDGNYTSRSGDGLPSEHEYEAIATYARRDIVPWRAQLTLGDSHTSGEMFDSIGVRGVQLATDDRMLPESLRGYAPTVRGVAESNARVSIRQNGVLLYETTVTPGPFVIDDLYATGYGGDLTVNVTEADGRVREFSVPYAAVPQLLRPGTTRFAIAAGQVHDDGSHDEPLLFQGTLQRGLSNLATGYGGFLASDGYAAALGGIALNTRAGAVALDLTAARTKLPAQPASTGQSLRATYSKLFPTAGTSFSLASYRYSTDGYYSLREALAARDFTLGRPVDDLVDEDDIGGLLTPEQRAALQGAREGSMQAYASALERQRNRFDLTLNQRLGRAGGALYASASARDYWTREGTDLQFQLGYNNQFRALSYSLTASRLRDVDGRFSNQFFVSVSVPLGTGPRAPSLTAGVVRTGAIGDTPAQTQSQMTLAGTAGADSQVSYGASATHSEELGTSASVNGTYRGSVGVASASYGEGEGYSQASLGLSGTVVAHPRGVTFGQPAGDTVAIVSAPHARGARVVNAPGVHINGAGFALVPYLTPYNRNTIELDPKGLSLDVQLTATSAHVAPHAGSVALVTFDTTHGRSLLARVRLADGQPLPFGAQVTDVQGRGLGVVGQGGRILLRGIGDAGALQAGWHDAATGAALHCSFDYQAPATDAGDRTAYPQVEAICSDVTSDARES